MKRSIWGIGIVTLLSCAVSACSPAAPADMVGMKENELYKWELLTILQEMEQ